MVILVPYILCLAGSRLHNRLLCIRSGLSVSPRHGPSLPAGRSGLVRSICPRPAPVACRRLPYGLWLTSFALGGLLLRGVGCILGCGDWADRLACLMYLSGCLYIIVLMASDIPSSMVFTFLLGVDGDGDSRVPC